MFTNTITQASGYYPWKQLYLLAFVDLVILATEKVEYYLESEEEYSEGKILKSETESGNGNVNTGYFINQAGGNTRISHAEFVYD